MHKIFITISLIFLLVFSFGFSQTFAQSETQSIAEYSSIPFDSNELSESGKKAYQGLMNAKIFSLSGYGVAAVDYPPTKDLASMLKEKRSEKALQSLVRNATTEGQIYALVGLQVTKSKAFAADFAVFKTLSAEKENDEISSESGGCGSYKINIKRAEIIEKLEKGVLAEIVKFKFGIKQ